MTKKSLNYPKAWVVSSVDRGRKSIKNGNVYLKNDEEFQIEIFNPLKNNILADIKLNGNKISNSGLIVKPGQRIYLDCFIDDKRKFIFKTYQIDGSNESIEATKENGLLEVYFYKESVINNPIYINYPYYYYPYYYPCYYYQDPYKVNMCNSGSVSSSSISFNDCKSTTNTNLSISGSLNTGNYNISTGSYNIGDSMSFIETGRVEKGDKSSQKFKKVNMDFENYYISSTILNLLPESKRPLEYKDFKNINKRGKDIVELIELIEKLSELHEKGILTNDEFINKKLELLSKI